MPIPEQSETSQLFTYLFTIICYLSMIDIGYVTRHISTALERCKRKMLKIDNENE